MRKDIIFKGVSIFLVLLILFFVPAFLSLAEQQTAALLTTDAPGLNIKPIVKTGQGEAGLFTMELRDVEIGDLMRVFSHDYKLNIILDKKVSGKITASFNNITLEEAMEKIAENNNLRLEKTDNVIKVTPNLITTTFVLKYIEAKKLLEGVAASPAADSPAPATKANSIYDLLSAEGRIFFDNQTNSITVIDYPKNINSFKDYLDKIDIAPRQVLVEAKIVEVKLQKEHALGVNWQLFAAKGGLETGPFNINSAAPGLAGALEQQIPFKPTYYPPAQSITGQESPFTITIFDENINVVLKMLSNQLNANILSAPRVTTINNQEAEIEMIQKYPWAEPQVQVSQSQQGAVTVTWKINFEDLGINLKATPVINEDGKITLALKPQVSEKTGDYTLTVQQGTTLINYTVPIVDKRSALTKVVVGNGQTLIIGGMMKNKITKGQTKVPLLGDIPFLSYLFKSKKEVADKTELLIFVSPTIVTESEFIQMAREERFGIGRESRIDKEKKEKMLKELEALENSLHQKQEATE